MLNLALLSFHGCPVARLGEKDTGGMNVYVMQLAKELGSLGHKVDVYTRYHDPKDPEIVELGKNARVIHLAAGYHQAKKEDLHRFVPQFLRSLYSFQRRNQIKYDLIHSNYWLSGRVGIALSEEWDIPHVSTFHTLAKTKLMARAGERESDLRSTVEKTVMDMADTIVVTTEMEKEDLVRLYGAAHTKIKVNPAGVDLDLFRPMDKLEARGRLGLDESRIILYVGRIEPLKGIDILLEAVSLMEWGTDYRLIIVGGSLEGDEHLEFLKNLARELGIEDKVSFTGSIEQDKLPSFYSAADVFVLPSHHESFGLVALEAMACGSPVIASRVGGLKTFLNNGESGYLIPWQCPEPFAQRLDILLANPSLMNTMGNAAKLKALDMGWGGVAERMLDLYTGLLHEPLESVAGASS